MIQISIIRNNEITNQATFPTSEEGQAWLSSHEGMGTFGQKAGVKSTVLAVSPAVLDADGKELIAAVTQTIEEQIPGYKVEIVDLTAKLAQEKINADSQALLDSTDWLIIREMETGIACPEEIKAQRAAARAAIVR
jgi:hypothetical protein